MRHALDIFIVVVAVAPAAIMLIFGTGGAAVDRLRQ